MLLSISRICTYLALTHHLLPDVLQVFRQGCCKVKHLEISGTCCKVKNLQTIPAEALSGDLSPSHHGLCLELTSSRGRYRSADFAVYQRACLLMMLHNKSLPFSWGRTEGTAQSGVPRLFRLWASRQGPVRRLQSALNRSTGKISANAQTQRKGACRTCSRVYVLAATNTKSLS